LPESQGFVIRVRKRSGESRGQGRKGCGQKPVRNQILAFFAGMGPEHRRAIFELTRSGLTISASPAEKLHSNQKKAGVSTGLSIVTILADRLAYIRRS
jgi:hypothetical protein